MECPCNDMSLGLGPQPWAPLSLPGSCPGAQFREKGIGRKIRHQMLL